MSSRVVRLLIPLSVVWACGPQERTDSVTEARVQDEAHAASGRTKDEPRSRAAEVARELERCTTEACAIEQELVSNSDDSRPLLIEIAVDERSSTPVRKRALEILSRLPRNKAVDDAQTRALWNASKATRDRSLRHAFYRAMPSTHSSEESVFEEVKRDFLAASGGDEDDELKALLHALAAFPIHTLPFALHALETPDARARTYARIVSRCATQSEVPLLNDALNDNPSPLVSIVVAKVLVQMGQIDKGDILCDELERSKPAPNGTNESSSRRHRAAARAVREVADKLSKEQRARAARALEHRISSDESNPEFLDAKKALERASTPTGTSADDSSAASDERRDVRP